MNALENPYATPDVDDAVLVTHGNVVVNADLSRVALGLTLIYAGICLALLSVVLAVVAQYVLDPKISRSRAIAAPALLSWLVIVFGYLFCTGVPAVSRARRYAVLAVALQFVAWIMPYIPITPSLRYPAVLGASALTHLFFVVFMRQMAIFLCRPDLVRKARNLLVLLLVTFVVVGFSMVALSPVLFLAAILALFVFVFYANLVNDLRVAVRDARRVVASL